MIEFVDYYYLILLLLIVPLVLVFRKTGASLSRPRLYVSLASRILLVIAIVMALADARIKTDSTTLSTVFLLDRSKSATLDEKKWAECLSFVNQALKQKPAGDLSTVAVFGKDTSVELPMSAQVSRLSEIRSTVNSNYTSIADALRTVSGLFPEYGIHRIVLVSDGNETSGDALREAKMLASSGIEIDTVPITLEVAGEVMVDYVNAPVKVSKFQPFDLKIGISSMRESSAKVFVYRDNELVLNDSVALHGGGNIVRFRDRLSTGGIHEYKVVIEPEDDTLYSNNAAFAFCKVKTEPRVLLCEGDGDSQPYMVEALQKAGINVDVVSRSGFPYNTNEIIKYDAVILSDVNSSYIDMTQNKFMHSYVRDMGGGFIMIGGMDSFGGGGYINTPVDEMLPVGCEVKKKHTLADIALVVVLDQSGSMCMTVEGGQTKMELANQAAAAVVEVLSDRDSVGVLAVDTAPKWVAELQTLGNRDEMRKQILANRPGGGGIYVFTGLTAAGEALKKSKASIKHILLFADGSDSEQKEGSKELVEELLAKHKITTTAVSIGIGYDSPWLKKLAEAGKGRFYATEDANELPRIFLWETFISSKSAFVEKKFVPQIEYVPEMLKGIDWARVAPLYGYNVTTSKDTAEVIMEALESDPLLARWQFGLGRSLAFTSDAKPRWAKDWMDWDGSSSFWPQAVRWVMRNMNDEGLQTAISFKDNAGQITAELKDTENRPENFARLNAIVSNPNAGTFNVELRQTGIGVYEGGFEPEGYGNYYVTICRDDKTVLGTYAKSISYPVEFKKIDTNEDLLKKIAQTGGGIYDIKPEQVFKHTKAGRPQYKRLWQILFAMALFFLLLDVAARRMVYPQALIEKIASKIRRVAPEQEMRGEDTGGKETGPGDRDLQGGTQAGVDSAQNAGAAGEDKTSVPAVKLAEKTVKKAGKEDLPESTGTMKRLLEIKGKLKKRR